MKKIVSSVLVMSVLGFANISMAKTLAAEETCNQKSSAGLFKSTNPVRTVATKSASPKGVTVIKKTKSDR